MKKTTFTHFATLFLLCWLQTTWAIGQDANWKNYLHSEIQKIVTTPKTVWCSTTYGGLIAIDLEQKQTRFYNKTNSVLKSNWIYDLAAAQDGSIWMTGKYGITHFDGISWTSYTPENSLLPKADIKVIATSPNGAVYCISGDYLGRFDGENWSVTPLILPEIEDTSIFINIHPYIGNLAVDGEGTLWAGGNGRLFRMKNPETNVMWEDFTTEVALLPQSVLSAIEIDPSGELWIGTVPHYGGGGGGMAHFDGENFAYYTITNSDIKHNHISNIAFDQSGRVYYTSWGETLGFLEGETFGEFDLSGLAQDDEPIHIRALVIDEEDNFWLSLPNHLQRFDGALWTDYDIAPTLSSHAAYQVGQNADGHYIVGSNKGIVSFDGENWDKLLPENEQLPHKSIFNSFLSPEGTLWLSTYNGLVEWETDGTWTSHFHNTSNIARNTADAIMWDESGLMWAGMYGGLRSYDGENWTLYDYSNSNIPSQDITALAQSQDGRIWLGTRYNKLAYFENGQFGVLADFPYKEIHDLVIDDKEEMWVAGPYYFSHFDGATWTHWDTKEKFNQATVVWTITEDGDDLWLATNIGAIRFHKEDDTFELFNENNSALTNNRINHIFIDDQNNKWFSTEVGLAVYHEDGVQISDENVATVYHPQIFLEQNIPNPSTNVVRIAYRLEKESDVTLALYAPNGQLVKTLERGQKMEGRHQIEFSVANLTKGLYIYQLQAGEEVLSKQMVVVRH
ncbi:MAG: two-component regulator propeller domain-containing protein [Chitinophagales bacterium]